MHTILSRRRVLNLALCGAAAWQATQLGRANATESPAPLEWFDLVPPGAFSEVKQEYNGKRILIAGYAVPMEFDSIGVTEFLLVPYVGACIHVPRPPPNQIIYVKTPTPYEVKGLFEPVYVTGELRTETISTEIAAPEATLDGSQTVAFDVGYSLAAEKVEPYVLNR